MPKKETSTKEIKETKKDEKYFYGLGRRKTAIAKVRLYSGNGKITINDKDEKGYFGGLESLITKIQSPLSLTGQLGKFDIKAVVNGGGVSSQADAILLGVARAIMAKDETLKSTLRKGGFLTRDPRVKERKKPGLLRARKAPQFSKR
ncbi:MAG TPA: 30S ribosomal protein S9 [Patescibacteria group bacterium]|nr:30S ribosomal protein S9 [Patescibacteria group bacterium]